MTNYDRLSSGNECSLDAEFTQQIFKVARQDVEVRGNISSPEIKILI